MSRRQGSGGGVEWPAVRLAALLRSLESGSRPKGGAGTITQGIPSLGGEHLGSDGSFRLEKIKYVPEWHFSGMTQGVITRSDILLVKDGATTGKVALVRSDFPYPRAAVNEHVFILRVDQGLATPAYVFYFLLSARGQAEILRDHRGATIGGISRGFASDIRIPLPALSEQRRIVEILDQADRLRRLRAEADARAERILPALFIKMFGDPATNPMGWPVVPLRQLALPLSGGAFPLAEQGLIDGEIPFIKVSDMNTEGNEWFIRTANHYVSSATLKRLRVKPAPAGTVVFPKIGAAVATNKKRLLVRDTAYDNNVIGVVPKESNYSSYLFSFFERFDLRTLARSTALPSIKTSELARLPIPKPTPYEAEAFAAQFNILSKVRDRTAQSSERSDALFKTVLHLAFSGRLTASWREAHMKELVQEMEQQAKVLGHVEVNP